MRLNLVCGSNCKPPDECYIVPFPKRKSIPIFFGKLHLVSLLCHVVVPVLDKGGKCWCLMSSLL